MLELATTAQSSADALPVQQLWVADIAYIRLQPEFVDLAVLLDAYNRHCIG
jgi:hypothetical protein